MTMRFQGRTRLVSSDTPPASCVTYILYICGMVARGPTIPATYTTKSNIRILNVLAGYGSARLRV